MASGNNSGKRSGLGRGLGALITRTDGEQTAAPSVPDTAERATADAALQMSRPTGMETLPLSAISPNPHQPRTHFDEEALEELAASVREHGIIQPLIVTRADSADRYWLVAGERRWRAAQMAELSTAPVVIREASERQLMELALIENVQREDLNPLEESAAYQALMDEHNLTQAEVAVRVGKSRSAVANAVRLLQLSDKAKEALLNQEISSGHARALLSLVEESRVDAAVDEIIKADLTVRQTEALVKQWINEEELLEDGLLEEQDPSSLSDPLASHWRGLEDRFRVALGTRVALNRGEDGAGRLIVHFYSDDDLDNLFHTIVGEDE